MTEQEYAPTEEDFRESEVMDLTRGVEGLLEKVREDAHLYWKYQDIFKQAKEQMSLIWVLSITDRGE